VTGPFLRRFEDSLENGQARAILYVRTGKVQLKLNSNSRAQERYEWQWRLFPKGGIAWRKPPTEVVSQTAHLYSRPVRKSLPSIRLFDSLLTPAENVAGLRAGL
jgi:hypothetical protein